MCKELDFWRDTHEGKEAENERFTRFLEDSERNGRWALVKRVVGVEVKQVSAIES